MKPELFYRYIYRTEILFYYQGKQCPLFQVSEGLFKNQYVQIQAKIGDREFFQE